MVVRWPSLVKLKMFKVLAFGLYRDSVCLLADLCFDNRRQEINMQEFSQPEFFLSGFVLGMSIDECQMDLFDVICQFCLRTNICWFGWFPGGESSWEGM